MCSGLLDYAWLRKRRRDVCRASDDGSLTDDGGKIGDAVDAVLQRQHRRPRPEHRYDERQRRRVVVGLDRDDDHVNRANLVGILFRARLDDEVAEHWTADLEPATAYGLEVGTARDEGHVVSGTRQPRA